MLGIFDFLKPAPFLPEIEDQEYVNKKYKYWRFRIFYSMFIGYVLYYFTRKSFTFAMPAMIEFGYEKSQLGLLASIFAISYGLSKFVSGIIGDQTNPRYLMAMGLILTGIINILFGMASSVLVFAILWGLNGWFQGFGWPPCARYLTHWYSHSERGSWWAIWNVSHNVGGFLIAWIAGLSAQYFGWRYAMYIPGVICILGGLYLINRLRDSPQSLGLPPIEKYRNDYSATSETPAESERQLSPKEILMKYVLKNKYIWILAIAYFFVYIVRTGVNDWTAVYFVEAKGYTKILANGIVSMFEVGGFFGSLFAGWSSDYFFKAKRGPINTLFSLGMLITVTLFWFIPPNSYLLDSLVMFLAGFMIFGPQMMIGVAAAELSHKNAAATATGFAGTFAYIGAAFAGYPLGKITQDWGWNGFFIALIICSALSFLLLAPLWNVTSIRRR